MADVPKAPLIARLKEKCTFLAKEPAPPQNNSHLEVTFIALKDSVEQYVATYTDQELQKELDKYIATQTPPNIPNITASLYAADRTISQISTDLGEANC